MANLRTKTWWRLLVTGLLIGLLAGPTHILATKVSDLTALTVDDIADPSDVYVLVTDAQSTAASRKVPLDQLGLATHLRLLTATSHGLAAGDVGKPLYGNDVFDDTSNSQYPTWVLAGIVDANTLLVAGDGAQVTIDVAKLQNGASYDVNTLGYAVYWDYSASTYYAAKPDDSESFVDPVLLVTSVGVSTFDAIVVAKGGLQATSDRIVRATGLVAIDQANFNAAETALEALGGGRICIEGKITLDTDVNFTQPISLYGIPGTSPEIELTNDTSINWQSAYSPFSGSSTTIPATAAKQSFVKVPTGTLAAGDWIIVAADDTIEGVTHSNGTPSAILSGVTADAGTNALTYTSHGMSDNTAVIFTLSTNDGTMPGGLSEYVTYWVVNKTANTFQVATTRAGSAIDITSAGSAGTGALRVKNITANCPAEMHQVKEIRGNDGTYDYAMIDDIIVDAMTVNPRIYELEPMEGYEVENIKFSWTGDSTPTDAALNFRKSVNVRVSNCVWDHNGPNEIQFNFVANAIVDNLVMQNHYAYSTDDGYGVVVGLANNVIVSDSIFHGARHAFTTTSAGSVVNGARYGTPRNVVVSNCIAHQTGKTNSSLIAFDTHAEGWGIVFDSCKVTVPYDPRNPQVASPTYNTNYGFQSRARHTTFRNCIVEGSGLTYGISILADDCRVEHCSVQNGWRGIYCREDTQTPTTSGCNRLVVKNSSFEDLNGAGVICANGDAHQISYCEFDNVGVTSYSGISAACIHMGEGTGHRFHNNSMPKQSNTYSIGGTTSTTTGFITTDISGNTMTGYTGGATTSDSGLDATHSQVVLMQTYCDAYNFTD